MGSGAISLSIVQENKNANVYASDVSADAIQVAKLNMSAIGASSSRLEILEGNLFEAFSDNLKSRIDLVISNPPYIGLDEKNDVEESVLNYEPHLALFSGEQGDEIIDKIIKQSRDWLNDNGTLLMEISPRHEKHIREFVQQNGFSEVNFYNDLTNRLRFVSLSF
ncbi:MAG: HemK/PrmC family methyltransferase [Acidimicrobiia bacterium]